ncbi:MAG: hypothetical protein DWP97_09150 [Calditrichaeota bacterium]|nr:MAG: hypothetical protein DWP97_09150 [Calditrichota bacterium]
MRKKLNCWEFNNCGREKGGLLVKELGECPVPTEMKYDGQNDGKGAGRACWQLPDSNCLLKKSNTVKSCLDCQFYKRVQFEEKMNKSRIRKLIIKSDLVEA